MVELFIVATSIASSKMAEAVVVTSTPAAPFTGVTEETVGGTISPTSVVNDQLYSVASASPAASFTPGAPPLIVIVYTVELTSATDGVIVAVFVPALYET